jgi:hypothetical protein
MSEEFPQWGFMLTGYRLSKLESASYKRHLFINEKETSCGWKPDSTYSYYKFSATPVVPGIYDVQFEVYHGRRYRVDDFKQCKTCLKIEKKDKPKEEIEMTIKYTNTPETFNSLLQEYGEPRMTIRGMHEGAFRKRLDTCPHCEYKRKKWLVEKLVVEVSFIADLKYGPMVSPEERAVVICVCPRCEKKNIQHYMLNSLLNADFIDKAKVKAELKKRNLSDTGFKVRTKEQEEIDSLTSQTVMAQRVYQAQAELGLGLLPPDSSNEEIPDFELPCWGTIMILDKDGYNSGKSKKCDVIWTKENSNPSWRTATHLVARCPKCNAQRSITKDLEKMGLL